MASFSLDMAIDNIIDKTFETPIRPCFTLVPDDGYWPNGNLFREMPSVNILPNRTNLNGFNFMRLLGGRVKCLISLAGPESLEEILSMTRPVDNHVNIYLDDKQPPDELLIRINRPLVWINGRSQVTFNTLPLI